MTKSAGWLEIEALASYAFSPPSTDVIADAIYAQIRGEVTGRVNGMSASDRVRESWRRHAREEYLREVYAQYPRRYIVGLRERPFLAETNRIFLEDG